MTYKTLVLGRDDIRFFMLYSSAVSFSHTFHINIKYTIKTVMKDMIINVFITCMIPLSFSSSSCRFVAVFLFYLVHIRRFVKNATSSDEGVPLYSAHVTVDMWYVMGGGYPPPPSPLLMNMTGHKKKQDVFYFTVLIEKM